MGKKSRQQRQQSLSAGVNVPTTPSRPRRRTVRAVSA